MCFFFQAEDGIRDDLVTGVSDVCSTDIKRSCVSTHGQRSARSLTISTRTSTSAAISTAVPDNSPSPCRACTSPIHNKPPVTDTGKYTRAPTAMTLWARLPPHRAGVPQLIGSPLRDQRGYLTPPERQFVRRPGGP